MKFCATGIRKADYEGCADSDFKRLTRFSCSVSARNSREALTLLDRKLYALAGNSDVLMESLHREKQL